MPKAYKQLLEIRKKLEKHYKDMQDIEFTIENGKLCMLQCRNGKRTGFAAVRIAVDMVDEGLIPKEEALAPRRAGGAEPAPAAGLRCRRPRRRRSRTGAARQGHPRRPRRGDRARSCSSPTRRRRWPPRARPTSSSCRHETSPEDIRGMNASLGLHDRVRRHDQPRGAGRAGRWARSASSAATRCRSTTTRGTMKVTTAKGTVSSRKATGSRIDGFAGEVIDGRVDTTPREVIQVLIEKNLEAEGGAGLPALRQADGLGGRGPQAARARQRRPARSGRRRPSRSAPRASACAAPSTCSSARARSARCAR